MNSFTQVVDMSLLRHSRVRSTSVPNVWEISLPGQSWSLSGAENERRSIVSQISSALPYRVLWLSDWASDDGPGWRILPVGAEFSLDDAEIQNGAWALFFFGQAPGQIKDKVTPADPIGADEAVSFVHALGAAAAIWSWYDDNEWLVVVPSAT